MDKNDRFDSLMKTALDIKPNDSARIRMQQAMQKELADKTISKEIMTFVEVAEFMRVSPSVLEDYLESLPCFEVGGNLLFRKEAVLAWIEQKEKHFNHEIRLHNSRDMLKFDGA